MSPRFSIVIPAYNRAELLKETIASVQAQSFEDWECIIVDDGSTDHTRQVVKQIACDDPRIRYVHQPNAERSAARNNGIRHSKGQYICFLDSDDRYLQQYLDRLNAFILSNGDPKALIISSFCIWDGSEATPVAVPAISGNVAEWLFTHPVSPSRACIHKDILTEFQFRTDIVMVEDSVLWCSIATKHPVILMPECMILYRVHDGNSVNRATTAAFKRHDGLLKFFRTPFSSALSRRTKRHLLSDVRFRMAEYHAANNDSLKALGTVMWSLFTAPDHMHTKAKGFFILMMVPGFGTWWNARKARSRNAN
ncbi:MAG: glycosyltransferase family 2 protein [Flavobacteriales bacterium]|nr:glycosyltransferase family 2 protein [Flavobacteriales bacterium]